METAFQPGFVVWRLAREEKGPLCFPLASFCDVNAVLSIFCPLSGEKESWIRSKYVEKKFIQKLPETGRNVLLLRRSSARRKRNMSPERTVQKPPLKPKPTRSTLPRVTGRAPAVVVVGGGGYSHSSRHTNVSTFQG